MDIQKEREAFLYEFGKTEQYRQQYGFYKIPLKYDEQKETWNFYDVQAAWEMWQSSKAQAVPEGFVLMPIKPTEAMVMAVVKEHEGDAFLPYSLYDAYVKQAMIEAQEPANEL